MERTEIMHPRLPAGQQKGNQVGAKRAWEKKIIVTVQQRHLGFLVCEVW